MILLDKTIQLGKESAAEEIWYRGERGEPPWLRCGLNFPWPCPLLVLIGQPSHTGHDTPGVGTRGASTSHPQARSLQGHRCLAAALSTEKDERTFHAVQSHAAA